MPGSNRTGSLAAWWARIPLYYRALLLAVLPTLHTASEAWRVWRAQVGRPPSWLTNDIDTGLIHDGLTRAPHFLDTLRWWVGPWVGEVPFYRPLTSYLFWIEWKLFGDREYLFGPPALLAHVAATVAFAALAFRLAERWRAPYPAVAAVAGGWLFAGLGLPYRSIVLGLVAHIWKNQPDSMAALCSFIALCAYLRVQEQRAQEQHRAPWAAGAWYLAACGFKEVAIALPLVCLVLEGDLVRKEGWRPSLRRVALLGGLGLLFFLVRRAALGGIGYTYGSNRSWLGRTLLEFLGPFGMLVIGYWIGVALALLVAALVVVYRLRVGKRPAAGRRRAPAGTGAVLCLVGLGLLGSILLGTVHLQTEGSLDRTRPWYVTGAQALLLWTDPRVQESVLTTLLTLAVIVLLWKRCRPALWLGLTWSVAFLAPLAMSPGPPHRYYLAQGGYFLCAALAVSWVTPWLPTRSTLLSGFRRAISPSRQT